MSETLELPVINQAVETPEMSAEQAAARAEFLRTPTGMSIGRHKVRFGQISRDIAMRFLESHDQPAVFTAISKSLADAHKGYLEENGLRGSINFDRLEVDKTYAQEIADRINAWKLQLDSITDELIERPDLRVGNTVRVRVEPNGQPLAASQHWMIDSGTPVTANGELRVTADNPKGFKYPPLTQDIPINEIVHGDSRAPYST